MKKSNSLFGLKSRNNKKFIPPTQIVEERPETIRRGSIKIEPVVKNERNKKLDVIIISVNYNDYLLLSLSYNTKIFENITVVTSTDDLMCQKICEKFGVKCVITDIMYDEDSKFNKGKAINFGIKSIKDSDLILLLDADIIITEEINLNKLDDDALYTSSRWICKTYQRFQNWEKSNNIDYFSKYENNKGFGFFQLFDSNNKVVKNNFYPENFKDASMSDLVFRDKFTIRKNIDNKVIHLGEAYTNWSGRKTERFLTDDDFLKILNNIKKKVIYKDKNLIKLLDNIKYESIENHLYFDIEEKEEVNFMIHVSSIYKPKDNDSIRRNDFAQKTWKSLYESGNVIPAMIYEQTNELPKIKDIFDYGYKFCKNDSDIILYTNSDICITEDAYEKIIESCRKYQCTFSFRKDFQFNLERTMTKYEVSDTKFSGGNKTPTGADLFAVTKKWWERWSNYLPDDQLIGRPTWDWIFRITMGKSIEGDIVFKQIFEKQGTICETPNISYHETHNSYWERPENLLEETNMLNIKIAYKWMNEKSNYINFTGKDYFLKKYRKNLI